MKKVSIGKAAEIVGVHPEILRRWEKADLETQVILLESFCAANGWTYQVKTDYFGLARKLFFQFVNSLTLKS